MSLPECEHGLIAEGCGYCHAVQKVSRERDAALAEWSTLSAQVEQAVSRVREDGWDARVAIRCLWRYLAENPGPR